MGSRMSITLNARLRPLDRGARYEIPLQEILGVSMPGSRVTGAGTLLSAEREAAGAPKGSRVRLGESGPVPFGVTEGLAVYLNGTDLPGEVYASSDIDELIAALSGRPRQRGRHAVLEEGPARNGAVPVRPVRMAELIADVLARFPLAQRCRVVPARTHTALQKLTCERDAPAGTLRPVGGQVSTFPAQVGPRQEGAPATPHAHPRPRKVPPAPRS